MKRSLTRIRDLVLALAATAAVTLALDDAEWRYRQPFELEHAGVVAVAVPLETLDKLQADLRDLRIVGPDGAEVAFALVRPLRQPARWVEPKNSDVRLQDDAVVVTLDVDAGTRFDAVELLTPAPRFLEPVRIESSADGQHWQLQKDGVPFFRQFGASQTVLPLAGQPTGWIRLTIRDTHGARLAVTGARLREAAGEEAATESIPIRIARIERYATESLVTIDLPASNLELKQLELQTPEPLFTRVVRAAYPRLAEGEVQERVLATGTVYRVRLDGAEVSQNTLFPIDAAVPSRELLLHVENGDSPALRIDRIETTRAVTLAVFAAPGPGRYECLSGNPHASAPRYDVAALAGQVRRAPRATLAAQPLAQNPGYRPSVPLAGVALEGAALDPTAWSSHRAVQVGGPGVYRLELDLSALTQAATALSDVRLVRGDRQVPYLLEQTGLERSIELPVKPAAEPSPSNRSRWRVDLPRSGARLSALILQSPTPLFERDILVYEDRTSANGDTRRRTLVSRRWRRVPQEPATTLTLPLPVIEAGTLWIETDNGDNPPIELTEVRGTYPAKRLIFRTEGAEPLALLTGNRQAAAPRYDLNLVAADLLTSEKSTAILGAEQATAAPARGPVAAVYFWAALAAVVVVLLVIVAKLLPKPPAG